MRWSPIFLKPSKACAPRHSSGSIRPSKLPTRALLRLVIQQPSRRRDSLPARQQRSEAQWQHARTPAQADKGRSRGPARGRGHRSLRAQDPPYPVKEVDVGERVLVDWLIAPELLRAEGQNLQLDIRQTSPSLPLWSSPPRPKNRFVPSKRGSVFALLRSGGKGDQPGRPFSSCVWVSPRWAEQRTRFFQLFSAFISAGGVVFVLRGLTHPFPGGNAGGQSNSI